MKIGNGIQKLALALAIGGLMGSSASAIIAYNTPTSPTLAPAGIQASGAAYILGNEFTVNQSINVTAVGAFDSLLNGFGGTGVQVAIYQLTAGVWNQVTGTAHTFTGTPGNYSGSSSFYNLSSAVALGLGTYAIVAANYGNADNPDWNRNLALGAPTSQGTTFQTTTAAISIGGGNGFSSFYANGTTIGSTLGALTYGTWGTPNPTFGAGTFEFNLTPVPEAGSFAVAGVGLLGFVYIGRCYVQRRKLA